MENWAYNRAQDSLEDREQLFRLILENAPVGIFTVEPEGQLHSVNPYFCELLGYGPEELLAMNIQDVVHPDDEQSTNPQADKLLEGSISQFDTEGRFICKNGSAITADLHVNLVRNAAGEPQLFVGQLQDNTAEKKAADEKQRRDALLKLTFKNAPIGMVITGPDRKILSSNPALQSMLGYTREEMESMTIFDLTHPEDRKLTRVKSKRLWEGLSDRYAMQKRYLRKDGSSVTCQSHVSIVRDEQGAPMLTIGQIEDIEERAAAIREARRMRIYLKNIIDSMPSMLVGVDQEGLITQWNAVAELTTGVTATEALGEPVSSLLPIDEEQTGLIKEAISSGSPVKVERIHTSLNGQNRLVDALVYPLQGEDTLGAVIRLDDVTDRVRMQEMMVQTEKMLSVGGLAAGMAHEINNPLGAILQSCQNIKRRLSPDLLANKKTAEELRLDLGLVHEYMASRSVLKFLDRIEEAGGRASKIVKDMLSFSRRSELHFEPIKLSDLLETVLHLASSDYDLKAEYDIKQITFIRDHDPELGAVECDKTEIEQVMLNLILNAAQAMGKHSERDSPPQIRLTTRLDGDYARIEVADNGPGMDEETRRRLFEPFYTTKQVGVGTGLGLSVSYFIIYDQHQGSMRVESAPGEGARFIIRLPLRQKRSAS